MKRTRIAAIFTAAAMVFAGTAGSLPEILPLGIYAEAASKLAAPKNVKASVSGNSVTLTWSEVFGAKYYRVYKYEDGKYKKYKDTAKTKLKISDLSGGTNKFRVAALAKQNGKYTVQTKSKEVTVEITEVDMTQKISVNSQSSIRIDAGKAVIRIDPFKIKDEPHDADIILITHDHYDHFSREDIAKVRKENTIFAAPKSMQSELADAGITRAILLDPKEQADIGGFMVETVPAYNVGKIYHPKKNGWLGYIITVNGKRIYAAGDTDANDSVKAVKCHIALVPVGGTYTMDVKEAAELVNLIKPEVAIPIHYGSIVGSTSDGDEFAKLSKVKTVIKLQ